MTKLIVALDGMSASVAIKLAQSLDGLGILVKVNRLLFGRYGSNVITDLRYYAEVMADPKFHDIPETVKGEVEEIVPFKPYFITVHASGGIEMMREAVAAAGKSKILAVTVLTSFGEEDCNITYGASTQDKVLQLAYFAAAAGTNGIVCSAKELKLFAKHSELSGLIKVTPGIRPAWHTRPGDQKRVATPAEAVKMGADYIVVGRPIVKAANPVEAVKRTLEEIEEATRERGK